MNFNVTERSNIQIISVIARRGVSRKSGLPYEIFSAQCVIADETGTPVVGRMNLPQSLKETTAGDYACSFVLAVDMEGNVVPRVIALQPLGAAVKPIAVVAAKV